MKDPNYNDDMNPELEVAIVAAIGAETSPYVIEATDSRLRYEAHRRAGFSPTAALTMTQEALGVRMQHILETDDGDDIEGVD